MIQDTLLKMFFQPQVLIIVAILIIVPVTYAYLRKLFSKPKSQKPQQSVDDKMPYLLKDSVLTQAEFAFAGVLGRYVSGNCIILTKVSLHDVFEVDRKAAGKEYLKYFNKYGSRHVDFLICDKITFKPLYGVELDDSSHNTAKVIETDKFKDKLYASVGLPLVRIKYKKDYTSQDFGEITKLNNLISIADSVLP